MDIKTISSEITDRIVTEEQLLKVYNVSLDEWEIEKKVINTWEVGAKDPEGNLATTPLFQIKLWLIPKGAIKELNKIREEFIEDLKNISPKVSAISHTPDVSKSSHLLELNLFDLHLGKFSWDKETGQDYDLEIACSLFSEAVDTFIQDISSYNVEKILFPVGNDFFNSDRAHPFNSTTKGTPQEEDTRWQKTFKTGRKLLVDNVLKLSQIAPVDIIMIPGNHDFERNFYLGDSLEGWFFNNSNVNVDNSPSPRKYYKYHSVLLGYTHGDEEKIENLPLIMAQESPINWALTKYREFHLGHYHHKKDIKYQALKEHQGIILRFMGSLSGTDSWHHKKGFISNDRLAEAYLWSREKGLKATFNFRK